MFDTPGKGLMVVTYKTLPGVEWETYPPEYETQKYKVSEQSEDVIKRAVEKYKEGSISKSKLARIVGGFYGQTDKLFDDDEENTWDTGFKSQDIRKSAVPVNINLGMISQLDKLRANKNFARYLATHKDIPSQIKKQAATHAGPISTAPINVGNPFGYGGGNQSSGSQKGSMPTGTAGRNPWGRADGGLATMFQRR